LRQTALRKSVGGYSTLFTYAEVVVDSSTPQ